MIKNNEKIEGIGGWLILPFIQLIIFIMVTLLSAFTDYSDNGFGLLFIFIYLIPLSLYLIT